MLNWQVVGVWIAAGLLCLVFDDITQPYLTSAGRQPLIRVVAEHWQQLGATAGITCFVVAMLFFGQHTRKAAVFTLLAITVACQGSKYCFGRVRPHWTGDVTVFYGPFGYFNNGSQVPIDSLPSGHTAVVFAMAQVLAFRWPRWKWVWFVVAAGVAVSRTLCDVHFPSDVVFGALMGTLVGRWACGETRNAVTITSAKIVNDGFALSLRGLDDQAG